MYVTVGDGAVLQGDVGPARRAGRCAEDGPHRQAAGAADGREAPCIARDAAPPVRPH